MWDKEVLEVTLSAGAYAIARTPVEEKQVAMFGLENILSQMKTVERRPPLSVNEKEMLGNPGRRLVKVGDVVVPTNNIPNYVEWLAQANGRSARIKHVITHRERRVLSKPFRRAATRRSRDRWVWIEPASLPSDGQKLRSCRMRCRSCAVLCGRLRRR
jgi:hypothetical protein